MKKKLLAFALFLTILFSSVTSALAIVDPTSTPNNKFGIHIFNEKDLVDATHLVNSNDGDWGYVTIVITEAERDHDRWQKIFDEMRRLHLIPIVRLSTKATGATWDAPAEAEINNWVGFLNSLNWVVENRYVVINNEPNHAQEWGGRIDPAGYASYLKDISQKLKAASPDFFVLPAGLDPSSVNSLTTMTENKFLMEMKSNVPDVFDSIDGWTSHPYPSTALDIYNHELSVISKKLPIFITETGWPNNKYSESQISSNLISAFTNVWNDPRVVAVTPFILDYNSSPFDVYSWKKSDGTFYNFYGDVQKILKIKGTPVQIESGQIMAAFAQPVIITGTDFVGLILARNTGQTIWANGSIGIGSESTDFSLKNLSMNGIEPTKLGLIFFRAAEAQNSGVYTNSLFLKGTKDQKISNSFSIEAGFASIDKVQIQAFFAKMLSGLHFLGR
ncbi:MAG TPA: hypothetical protein VKC53_04320 [Patescibacteria group bacterium]|nr:hypothetical protein [Patescibacteria group bacterium]